MGSMYKIPLAVFLLLCFSFPSFAEDKVYTNKDLKPDSELNKVSRVDQPKGKAASPKTASRNTPKLEIIVADAKRTAARFIHEVKTNKRVQVAVVGVLLLIWIVCLLDILRFEFRGNNKVVWFIAVTFIPVAGWILYLLIGTRQKKYRVIKDYY